MVTASSSPTVKVSTTLSVAKTTVQTKMRRKSPLIRLSVSARS